MIGRPLLSTTDSFGVYLACSSGTGMYQSGRRQFSAYLVLPTGSGEARREANGRETRNWASGVALSHATLHDSLTD